MLRGIIRTRDRGKMTRSDEVRTVGIPTTPGGIGSAMSEKNRDELYESGRRAAFDFFGVQREYSNSFGLASERVIVPARERRGV